ncbi:MAG: GntR family transcriptional regulator [Ktedonobacteraceae bacterium]|nr:GntR family transcriptional regulator [Ktedonobacteraceae bacterium]
MLSETQKAKEEPRYRQIARVLRAEIEAERQPGEPIETETALEQRFGVSRITVRRAIDELVHSGLLIRRQGSGTFVAKRKVSQELGVLHSWTERMRELGLEPRTVDCEILQVVPPAWVIEALQLDPAAPESILRIQRLRYADAEPISLMVDYIRMRYAPDLAEKGLEGESLYETLERRYDLELARVQDAITARRASHFEARLLGIEPEAPVLCVTRITYLSNDEPVDAATVVSRADRYEYRVSGLPRRRSGRH